MDNASEPLHQSSWDIQNCDREPIHIPGAVQPHGLFLAFEEKTYNIRIVSENCESFLKRRTDEVLDHSLKEILSRASLHALELALEDEDLRGSNPMPIALQRKEGPLHLDGILHRAGGLVILELEPSDDKGPLNVFSYYHSVRQAIIALQDAASIDAIFDRIVQQVRRLTGFDRVSLYRFDENWNGFIAAETKASHMESYLHQSFPASDVPAQARRLYQLNWLRMIVDAHYKPARLVPDHNPLDGKPLDLSYSTLRSVSPIHLEYMGNMGMRASMSISLIKDDRLWGMISCHHVTPRYVPYEVRTSCEMLGQLFSYRLAVIEASVAINRRDVIRTVMQRLEQSARGIEDPFAFFERQAIDILRIADATGAAFVTEDRSLLVGQTPSLHDIEAIVRHLHDEGKEVFVSDDIRSEVPAVSFDQSQAAGFLAARLSESMGSYLIWFRPEIIQKIDWAGNPSKTVSGAPDGRLHPRKSFDLWRELVKGHSLPFDKVTLEAALELRNLILMKQIARVNAELVASNRELDDFASIVSHDLIEPLRGIQSYIGFVEEDEGHLLSEATRERLGLAKKLSGEMSELIRSLHQYSRVGRMHLAMEDVAIGTIMDSVLLRVEPLRQEQNVLIRKVTDFPRIVCDRVRVAEIFYNLILNGIKYNENNPKIIDIGVIKSPKLGDPIFFIKDNGIGIPASMQGEIFKIFRRLHASDEYGGGTGAGLAIVKRLVEKHSGRIWLESAPGKGSTFYFTLQPEETP